MNMPGTGLGAISRITRPGWLVVSIITIASMASSSETDCAVDDALTNVREIKTADKLHWMNFLNKDMKNSKSEGNQLITVVSRPEHCAGITENHPEFRLLTHQNKKTLAQ
jgi:hypothetical protein